MYIDIVEIWFWITNGQFHQFLTKLSARNMIVAGYYPFTLFLFKRDLLSFGNKFFPLRVDLFYARLGVQKGK